MTTSRPDRPAVQAALERVLASTCFELAERHKRFLRFIVEETLEGRGARLKGYTIGLSVFDRPADFDSQSDPLVRVEAGRLRNRLAQYYSAEGSDDPIRIEIPKGGYQPEFSWSAAAVPGAGASLSGTSDASQNPGPSAVGARSADRNAEHPAARQIGRRRRRRRLLSAAIIALLLISGLLIREVWQAADPERPNASPAGLAGLPDWPSIYVAPLASLGTDESLGFFARGISEEIMLSLRDYELIVIAGDRNGPAPEGPALLRELRDRLDVDYTLSGSVRNDGQRVRIVARLTDTTTGEVLWSGDSNQAFDVASLVATEERMAQEIVRAIAGPYGPIFEREFANLTRSSPQAIGSYNCLLRYYDYRRTVDVARIGNVTTCFEEAVRLEPGYADAWAGLSLILQDELLYGSRSPDTDAILQRARESALRGLDINGNSVLSQLAMQRLRFFQGDIDGVMRNMDRLVGLAPTDPSVLQSMSQLLIMLGEVEHGRALLETAARLDVNPSIHRYVAETLLYLSLDDFERAREAAVRIDAPNWYASHLFVAVAASHAGEEAMARRAAGQLLELRPAFAAEARGIFETFRMNPKVRDLMIRGLDQAGIAVE